MRLSFTQGFAFLFIFIGAVSAKAPGRRVYTSAQKEGVTLFHVHLSAPLKGNERVWLSYDLDGVQDYTAVSRSINDQLAVGGYFVRKRSGWEHQRERVSATWLRQQCHQPANWIFQPAWRRHCGVSALRTVTLKNADDQRACRVRRADL